FVCVGAIAFETRQEKFARQIATVLGFFGAGVVASLLLVNTFVAGPFDFRFWRDSLAQVAVYRWATPAAMTDQGTLHLFGALLIGVVVFVTRALTRTESSPITQRVGFLLGGFVFSGAVLQSALVRSDLGHVIIGEFPLIFLSSIILFSFRGSASGA